GWSEVLGERETLVWWLGQVPSEQWAAVVRAGTEFATTNGPFATWMAFCERALSETDTGPQRSKLLWLLANVARHAGDLERSSVAAEEMRELADGDDDARNRAAAWVVLADIQTARGQVGEAARILYEHVLPVLGVGEDLPVVMRLIEVL